MKLTEKIAAFLLRIFQMPRNRATQKFVNDFMQKLRFIEIVSGGFQIKDSGKNVLAEIKWYMVKDAELFDDRLVLYFLNNRPVFLVPEKYHQNWHQLIQEIPKGYPTYNYDAVKSFFENLQGCDICV